MALDLHNVKLISAVHDMNITIHESGAMICTPRGCTTPGSLTLADVLWKVSVLMIYATCGPPVILGIRLFLRSRQLSRSVRKDDKAPKPSCTCIWHELAHSLNHSCSAEITCKNESWTTLLLSTLLFPAVLTAIRCFFLQSDEDLMPQLITTHGSLMAGRIFAQLSLSAAFGSLFMDKDKGILPRGFYRLAWVLYFDVAMVISAAWAEWLQSGQVVNGFEIVAHDEVGLEKS